MKAPIIAVAAFIFLWISFINGCMKSDYQIAPYRPYAPVYQQPPILKNTFTQEFDTFTVLKERGWVFTSSNYQYDWGPPDIKGSYVSSAYSYKSNSAEYAYVHYYVYQDSIINMWMFTPPVEIKNGDRISFYTVDDTIPASINRLQVRLNPTDTTSYGGRNVIDAGPFTILVTDINSSQLPDGYPQNWTKMEYIISGLPGVIRSRIAFRYFITSLKQNDRGAIGVDLLQFVKS